MISRLSPNYPLLLNSRLEPKIWGGRRLQTILGRTLPDDQPYGESLESDGSNRILNGHFCDHSIQELVDQFPKHLLGDRGVAASAPFADFPLLAKFIDAADVLSIQVHPNDVLARPGGKRGKTEAWHILAADPGATLIVGLRPETTRSMAGAAIDEGRLEEHVVQIEVRQGDTLIIPAGTVHAIGAGVLLYEIQQTSDVTYRMYDWNRLDDQGEPRELHIEESLNAMKPDLIARSVMPLKISEGRTMLTACRYFALERWSGANQRIEISHDGGSFRLVSCFEGTISITSANESTPLSCGQTALIPACLTNFSLEGSGSALAAWIPDLEEEIRRPLLQSGASPGDVAQLSGALPDLT